MEYEFWKGFFLHILDDWLNCSYIFIFYFDILDDVYLFNNCYIFQNSLQRLLVVTIQK